MVKKNVIIGGAVAVVVGAAAYALLNKRANSAESASESVADLQPIREQQTAATQQPQKAAAPAATTTKVVAAEEKPVPKKEAPVKAPVDNNDDILEQALDEQVAPAAAARAAVVQSEDGVEQFPHLGLKIKPLPGWIVKEELSPMPNIAMIMVTTPELMEAQQEQTEMGAVPVIILSIEDINGENLDAVEFKDRSKQMAMQQMLMMTNGMAQPRIRYDDNLSVGGFTHCLEFHQSLPPILDIVVCNMIAVQNRVAYVFQIMCNQKTMDKYKPKFMEMARSVVIENVPDVTIGTVQITTTSGFSVAGHSTWAWNAKPSGAAIVEFTTPSTVRSELISVFEDDKAPSTSAWTVKGTPSTVNGVSITTFTESRNERKVLKFGGFTVVVKPTMKSLSKVPEASLVNLIRSVSKASESSSSSKATFVNDVHGYKFDVQQGSKIIATRVGGGTIVYAPMGVPSDPQQAPAPEQEGPTVTVRYGTPETDPDCCETLDGWKERLAIEKASGTTSDVQELTLSGHKCLSFISKDMQEVGPGQRLEVMGKVIIFVRNGATTLVRWECPSGLWKKFQPKFDGFMNSFTFL